MSAGLTSTTSTALTPTASGADSITSIGKRHDRAWRVPRARVLINGAEHPETRLVQFSVTRTRYAQADTAKVTLAIDRLQLADVKAPWWFDPGTPTSGSVLPDVTIALDMRDEAIQGAQWEQVFAGIVDQMTWQPDQTTLSIECRDYLAKLLDLRVQDAWLNLTGAELIRTLARAAGLSAQVSFPAAMTGAFWQIEHKRTAHSGNHQFQTAYDLARHIADVAGCDLYADGTTIVCAPYPTPQDTIVHAIGYHDPGPRPKSGSSAITVAGTGLSFKRNIPIARGVIVHALSWDSRQRTRTQAWVSSKGLTRTLPQDTGTTKPTHYTLRLTNLKQADVERHAQIYYNRIVAHDRTVSIELPGRMGLAPRQFATISGTGSSFDVTQATAYGVDSVSTQYSLDGMFTQSLTLRTREALDGSNTGADND